MAVGSVRHAGTRAAGPAPVSPPSRTIAAHGATALLSELDRLIARLIVGSTDQPAEWLVTIIGKGRAMLNCRVRKEAEYPNRAELRERLQKLTEAIREVRDAIGDFDMHHILLGQDDFLLNESEMYHGLLDLEKERRHDWRRSDPGKDETNFIPDPTGRHPNKLAR